MVAAAVVGTGIHMVAVGMDTNSDNEERYIPEAPTSNRELVVWDAVSCQVGKVVLDCNPRMEDFLHMGPLENNPYASSTGSHHMPAY